MAPDDYIAARDTVHAIPTDKRKETSATVDGRPYFPFLKVDGNDHSSIRHAVALVLRGDSKGSNDISTKTGDNDLNVQKFSRTELDHKCWQVAIISGGITNQLFRVDIASSDKIDSHITGTTKRRSVLLRIFGAEGMIDRDVENATFAALARQNIAPKYYGRFANGRVEEYLDGMLTLTVQQLSNPTISQGIAKQLARLHHQFKVPEDLIEYHNTSQPTVWSQLNDWMDQASKASFQNDADSHRASQLRLKDIPADLLWLQQEIRTRYTVAKVAFCHNDALAANILYDPTDGSPVDNNNVRLIDFEYGGVNYVAFDIANHFNEYAGGTEDGVPNYDWFPDTKHQMTFLKTYLQETANTAPSSNSTSACYTQQDIDSFHNQVETFLLVNHLYWGLWAVNQAATEGCQGFDYLLYAHHRLRRYFAMKSNIYRNKQ